MNIQRGDPRYACQNRAILCSLMLAAFLLPVCAGATEINRDSASPYGVLAFFDWNHDWNNYAYGDRQIERSARLLREAGISWVRMDFLWADIEPSRDHYDFAKYDRIVQLLQRHDLHVLAILEYNPAWRKGAWNSAPDPAAYVRYARATVRHFKERVKYWEIWNEPDSPTYWTPQDDLTAYSALLSTVYPAIKEEDPTALVLLGGLADSHPFHLQTIYRKAGRASFDIVNLHPFVSPLHAQPLEKLRGIYAHVHRIMAQNGDEGKPIWFTEIGCPGVPASQVSPANGWWEGAPATEAQQAQWLRLVYRHALEWPGVQKVFWAFFRDTPNFFGNGVDHFGLLRQDFSAKPAFAAYRQIAHEPPAAATLASGPDIGKTTER